MTEEEKKRIALEFFNAEKNRTPAPTASAVFDVHTAAITTHLAKTAKRRAVMERLAQGGISWDDLKAAYDAEFKRGHDAMLDFKLSFFYSSVAIAVHEYHPDYSADEVAGFMRALGTMPDKYTTADELIKDAHSITGMDTSCYDTETVSAVPGRAAVTSKAATRSDVAAVNRMQRSGITEKDLAYEKELGYRNGWNSGFDYSVCYAALALVLYNTFHCSASEIEEFIEKSVEISDSEISAEDILERARVETGVDVSRMTRIHDS